MKQSILVGDDEIENYKEVKRCIRGSGISVFYARNEKEVIAKRPNLILLDTLDTTTFRGTEPIYSQLKGFSIILFTKAIVNEDGIRKAGAVDYIHKPFTKKELLVMIGKHLSPSPDIQPVLIEVGDRTLTITDPFNDITLDMAKEISLQEYEKIFEFIKHNYADIIEEGFKTGDTGILLCDGKVVAKSSDPEGLTIDRINKIETELGKTCYAFSRTDN